MSDRSKVLLVREICSVFVIISFAPPPSFFALGILFLIPGKSDALVLYGENNTQNQTDPGTGVPFDGVARLGNSAGTVIGGTGVHLGNGYILTADHVGPFASVTFDGSTFFTHDGTAPVRVATGVDMKIFRLTAVPPVSAALIYTGTDELLRPATIVGWGRGRDGSSPPSTSVVGWGDTGTIAKRWGTNTPQAAIDGFSYSSYTFDALETVLGNSAGASEAAATANDSGSGLFQKIDDTWYLTGITSVVTQKSGASTSTFGTDTPAVVTPGSPTGVALFPSGGDVNLFVRTSRYATRIATLVPEPSSVLMGISGMMLFARRKR